MSDETTFNFVLVPPVVFEPKALVGPLVAEKLPDMSDYDCINCGELFCEHGKCYRCGEDCDTCSEAAFESWMENFYGGDTPQTDRERSIAEEKERLDR